MITHCSITTNIFTLALNIYQLAVILAKTYYRSIVMTPRMKVCACMHVVYNVLSGVYALCSVVMVCYDGLYFLRYCCEYVQMVIVLLVVEVGKEKRVVGERGVSGGVGRNVKKSKGVKNSKGVKKGMKRGLKQSDQHLKQSGEVERGENAKDDQELVIKVEGRANNGEEAIDEIKDVVVDRTGGDENVKRMHREDAERVVVPGTEEDDARMGTAFEDGISAINNFTTESYGVGIRNAFTGGAHRFDGTTYDSTYRNSSAPHHHPAPYRTARASTTDLPLIPLTFTTTTSVLLSIACIYFKNLPTLLNVVASTLITCNLLFFLLLNCVYRASAMNALSTVLFIIAEVLSTFIQVKVLRKSIFLDILTCTNVFAMVTQFKSVEHVLFGGSERIPFYTALMPENYDDSARGK